MAYCSRECSLSCPERIAKINNAIKESRPTRLELVGYAMLEEFGVAFSKQHVMCDKWCVDAFVPSAKLVIQFDGGYWHGDSRRFATLSAKQERQRRWDAAQNLYLTKVGYRIVRIWESDMHKRPDEVRRRLREVLAIPVPPEDVTCNKCDD